MSALPLVLGVFDPARAKARVPAIEALCDKHSLPLPDCRHPDFIQAAVAACDHVRAGRQAIVVGCLQDLRLPGEGDLLVDKDGIEEQGWREAWVEYLASNMVQWLAVDGQNVVMESASVTRRSVIRSYQRSYQVLTRLIAKVRTQRSLSQRTKGNGYSYGRPPYGYTVVGGDLKPDSARVPLIAKAFKAIRAGRSYSSTAVLLKKACKSRPGLEQEWWDTVKVRRLIQHSRLYCLGEYNKPGAGLVLLPHLAVLPKGWASTRARPFQTPKVAVK
jgi:hypothetical protein